MIVQKELFGESKSIEFKREIPNKHEKFLKDIIAFANTSGGKTIIGVEDGTGEVVGLGNLNPFKLSDAISNMVSDSCTPQIEMEITPKTIDGKTVLEVEVYHGKYCPYFLTSVGKDKSSYIRVNGTSRPADVRTLKELEQLILEYGTNRLLYQTRKVRALALAGRIREAFELIEELKYHSLCESCPYGSCKDLDAFEMEVHEIAGDMGTAYQLSMAGRNKWPDEESFVIMSNRLKKKVR